MNTAHPLLKPVRVLIVEDSPVVRELLVHIFESDPGTEVAGVATNGAEALAAVRDLRPDVITMDIHMPKMNGYEATQQIMREEPTPIVIVSGNRDSDEVRNSFRAVEAGAVATLGRPSGVGHPDFERESRELVRTVKAMAEVKLVRRRPTMGADGRQTPVRLARTKLPAIDLVAIGASTGGPLVLQTILSQLPPNLPFPILIVQHMATGFVGGFVEWLAQSTRFPVRLAAQGEPLLAGQAYIAPDGRHLTVNSRGSVTLNQEPAENGMRPAVSQLFRSLARTHGGRAAAILLTGMGVDGAQELKQLKELGAVTVAQDQASSVVFGMPGAAVNLDAASWVLAPDAIAKLVAGFAMRTTYASTGEAGKPENLGG